MAFKSTSGWFYVYGCKYIQYRAHSCVCVCMCIYMYNTDVQTLPYHQVSFSLCVLFLHVAPWLLIWMFLGVSNRGSQAWSSSLPVLCCLNQLKYSVYCFISSG